MKSRIFIYVACECGHRGALIETFNQAGSPDHRYRIWLRNLSHAGTYQGNAQPFARAKPGCPQCGRSLGPDDIVGRSELQGTDELLFPKTVDDAARSHVRPELEGQLNE
jgi:hypothetical protein